MQCTNCQIELTEESKFCNVCGLPVAPEGNGSGEEKGTFGLTGFSEKINDPAFKRYLKNSGRWSLIFALILALAAIIGFFTYGEKSREMDNPQALFIGLGLGAMFLLIALFQIVGRKRSKTWDGVVYDRKVEQKRRRRNTGNNDYYWEDYTVYSVCIRSDDGKRHRIRVENDDTVFSYYNIGDKVRHHGGLNSYEKYDKSKDSIIFCNACSEINDISADICFRCKCPLLK